MQYLALFSQLLAFLNTPGGQQLIGPAVKTVEDLAGVVTGIVNALHVGVNASTVATVLTPVASVGAGTTVQAAS